MQLYEIKREFKLENKPKVKRELQKVRQKYFSVIRYRPQVRNTERVLRVFANKNFSK